MNSTPENPYAPPSISEPHPIDDSFEAARRQLSRPATAIIIMASIHSVFDMIDLVSVIALVSGGTGVMFSFSWFFVLLLFNIHVFQAICGAQMAHVKSLRLAYTGALLSCVPIVSPFFVLGIPFGVWAMVLLLKPSNQRAFLRPRS